MTFDAIDTKLLELLQQNGKIPTTQLAKHVGISQSATHRRIRILEKSGIIQRYVAAVDAKALGKEVLAFVHVQPATGGKATDEEVGALTVFAQSCPDVLEFHVTSGTDGFLLKVQTYTMKTLSEFLTRLRAQPGVGTTRTEIVLDTLKEAASHKPNGHRDGRVVS